MTTLEMEIIGGFVAMALMSVCGFVFNYIVKLSNKISDVEKEVVQIRNDYQRADHKLKGHIYNCVNYKARHKLDQEDL